MSVPDYAIGHNFFRTKGLLKEGETTDWHEHNEDHTAFIIEGCGTFAVMSADGKTVEHEKMYRTQAPYLAGLHVAKGRVHKFTAGPGGAWLVCAFAHRDADGNLTEEYEGNLEATF